MHRSVQLVLTSQTETARHAPAGLFLLWNRGKQWLTGLIGFRLIRNGSSASSFIQFPKVRRASVKEIRGVDFYRQRAGDMRRQAERAISPHLRETYLRIALDWERMADDAHAKDGKHDRADEMGSST